jgi:hypothetical protein
MLVMIDKDWAAAKDESGRIRLENAGDYVRMGIETALKRDIAVTPILIRGAHMPAADELPAEIKDLAYRSGFELSHDRWESDLRKLIHRLGFDVPAFSRRDARNILSRFDVPVLPRLIVPSRLFCRPRPDPISSPNERFPCSRPR